MKPLNLPDCEACGARLRDGGYALVRFVEARRGLMRLAHRVAAMLSMEYREPRGPHFKVTCLRCLHVMGVPVEDVRRAGE